MKNWDWPDREKYAEALRQAWLDRTHRARAQEFRDLMLNLVALFSPHTYVEIGVAGGYTFNAVSPLVKRAVAVDRKPLPEVDRHAHVEIHRMSSTDFAQVWQIDGGDTIDLLFIDADHAGAQVLDDVLWLAPFVRDGFGLILLHDTHPNNTARYRDKTGHAWAAAWELRTRFAGCFETLTLPGPDMGLTIIRKSTGQLAWRPSND